MHGTVVTTLGRFLSVSWNAFVGVFGYYTALVLLIVSGVELSAVFITIAFSLPVAALLALIVGRVVRAAARYAPAPVFARAGLVR